MLLDETKRRDLVGFRSLACFCLPPVTHVQMRA